MGSIIYQINTTDACERADTSHASIVLVVDDEKAMLAMVQDVLEDEGYRVLTATEGQEALKLAHQVCPDLIITDLMMPQMNGLALRRILADTPLTSDIPIILMTAAYQPGLDEHFDAVIAKPFHIDEFLEDVQRCASCDKEATRHGDPS